MYILKLFNKRYNNKVFPTYEAARAYARRRITAIFGHYQDAIGTLGFSVTKK